MLFYLWQKLISTCSLENSSKGNNTIYKLAKKSFLLLMLVGIYLHIYIYICNMHIIQPCTYVNNVIENKSFI